MKDFECKPGNITQCQCYGIGLTADMKVYTSDRYKDCLCRGCLEWLAVEVNLFRDKYISSE